ncbi:hypothetical protein D3C81_2305240 [compost metagenome]
MMILKVFGGLLEVVVTFPEKKQRGDFPRQEMGNQAHTVTEQGLRGFPIGLCVDLRLAREQLR